MKIPDNFGMKKEKQRPEFIEISGKMIRNIALYSVGALILVFGMMVTPWKELKTSLITPETVTQAEFLEEMKEMNMTLRAIQQKDPTIKSGHEYLLVKDRSGKIPFTVHENTCVNGVRLIARLRDEFRGMRQPQTGAIQITGIAVKKSRGVYNAVVTLSDAMPAQMRNLPNDMVIENDTVLLTYQISGGDHADRVEYKMECY